MCIHVCWFIGIHYIHYGAPRWQYIDLYIYIHIDIVKFPLSNVVPFILHTMSLCEASASVACKLHGDLEDARKARENADRISLRSAEVWASVGECHVPIVSKWRQMHMLNALPFYNFLKPWVRFPSGVGICKRWVGEVQTAERKRCSTCLQTKRGQQPLQRKYFGRCHKLRSPRKCPLFTIVYHCNILYIHFIYIYISYHYDISYYISLLFYYSCWKKGLKSPFFEDVHRWHEVLAQCQHELEKWQQEAQEQKEDLAKRAEAALNPSKSCTNLGLYKFFFWSFSTAHWRLVGMGGFQNLYIHTVSRAQNFDWWSIRVLWDHCVDREIPASRLSVDVFSQELDECRVQTNQLLSAEAILLTEKSQILQVSRAFDAHEEAFLGVLVFQSQVILTTTSTCLEVLEAWNWWIFRGPTSASSSSYLKILWACCASHIKQ